MIQKFIYAKVLILLTMWWAWTFLVDFFVIPTVFKTISKFFEAGDLGIAVFSKLNNLEMIVSSALLAILAFQTKRNKRAFPLFVGSILLFAIAMTYFTFLTPKIVELTNLWKEADAKGLLSIGGYTDIQQAHQFYHRLYVGIDSFKLLLLTAMIFFASLKEEKWT